MITNRLITNNIKFQKDSSCLHSAIGNTNLTIRHGDINTYYFNKDQEKSFRHFYINLQYEQNHPSRSC